MCGEDMRKQAGWKGVCVCVHKMSRTGLLQGIGERERERVVDSFGSTFSQVQSTLTQKEQKDASLPQLLTVHHTTKHPHPTLIHK